MNNSNPYGGTFDKIEVINDAYSQLRISGLTVEPTPEDLEVALSRLEVMAQEWATRNICSNWNFEDEPDPNSPSNVRRGYMQAYSTNLALRLIPDFNKQPSPILIAQARQSLSNLSGRSAMDNMQGIPYPTRQPRGSGNTLRYNRWDRFYRSGATTTSIKTKQMYIGDVNTFTEHFDAYLNDGETISSVQFTADSGIALSNTGHTDNDVNYTVTAGAPSGFGSYTEVQLTIVVTTSASRIETRVVNFRLSSRPQSVS